MKFINVETGEEKVFRNLKPLKDWLNGFESVEKFKKLIDVCTVISMETGKRSKVLPMDEHNVVFWGMCPFEKTTFFWETKIQEYESSFNVRNLLV